MPIPMHNTQTLINKIQSLPTERIAEVEDFVDFLKERTVSTTSDTMTKTKQQALNFPVDDLGPWPEALDLSRKALYGDNGR